MNRETKIGLVTGVTLIVLIGAMLSSYLSAPNHKVGDLSLIGQGSQLRNQISNPVGIAQVPVPQAQQPVAVAAAPVVKPVAPAFVQAATQYNQITQLPYGSSSSGSRPVAPTVPTVNPEVIPMVVAQVPAQTAVHPALPGNGNSTFAGPVQALATTGAGNSPSTQTATYTVRPGDTLGQIAWHFYHDSGPLAVRRIINANHGKLGSASAMLRVGETLTIPSASEQSASTHPQLLSMAAETTGNRFAGSPTARSSVRPTSSRIYRVESGDTLFGIARKLMGAGTQANVHRIMTLNHIRDPRTIYVGQRLTIPNAGQ